MAGLENTKRAIERFAAEKHGLLRKIYSPSRCSSVQQLRALMEEEDMLLLPVQHEITDELRKCCYEGMRADGVKYPEMAWARHVGSDYAPIYFPTIRSEAVQEALFESQRQAMKQQAQANAAKAQSAKPASGSAGGQSNAMIGGGAAAVGVTCAVVGCTMNPISAGLIALGIVITAVGAVVLINRSADRSKNAPESVQRNAPTPAKPEPAAAVPDEKEIVRRILEEQMKRCTEELQRYCQQAYRFACISAKEAGEDAQ